MSGLGFAICLEGVSGLRRDDRLQGRSRLIGPREKFIGREGLDLAEMLGPRFEDVLDGSGALMSYCLLGVVLVLSLLCLDCMYMSV